MKKELPLFVIVLICSATLAIFAAERAFYRGELMLFIVMIVIATIFWKQIQKSS